MKKTLLFLIALAITVMTFAQSRMADYMMKIPALPRDSCNISKTDADNFNQKVSFLIDEVSNDIQERGRKAKEYTEKNRGTMENTAVKQLQEQYNMSDKNINKLKNSKNMSEEEQEALVSKMMMQKTNMSLDELKKMSKMSDAGKAAWAESYATEAMANAQADPKKYAPDENARKLIDLTNEYKSLNQKINAGYQNITKMYDAIDNDPERKAILENISELNEKLMPMVGYVTASEEKIMIKLADQIKNEQIKYCDKFTPQYRAALKKHLTKFKYSLPDCERFDELTCELMKIQTGVDVSPTIVGTSSLVALKAYLMSLSAAYKYKLYYPDNN